MKPDYFYSNEQLEEFKRDLSESNISIKTLAKGYAKKYGRGITGIEQKLFKIARDVKRPDKIVRAKRTVKQKVAKVQVIEPQHLSIDVPEGTSFDFNNVKRVVLQQKSLTIYF
jgi:hypothetical protein